MLNRTPPATPGNLLSTLKHYVLVRPGLYPPTGRDYLGTGLTPEEFETLRVVFQISKLHTPDDPFTESRPSNPGEWRQRTQALIDAALGWRIHVTRTDLNKNRRSALGQVTATRSAPEANRNFPAVPLATKHLVHIQSGLNAGREYFVLLHELAHVFLGHVPLRRSRFQSSHAVREAEAELSAYLVCKKEHLDTLSECLIYLCNKCDELDYLSWRSLRQIAKGYSRLKHLHRLAGV